MPWHSAELLVEIEGKRGKRRALGLKHRDGKKKETGPFLHRAKKKSAVTRPEHFIRPCTKGRKSDSAHDIKKKRGDWSMSSGMNFHQDRTAAALLKGRTARRLNHRPKGQKKRKRGRQVMNSEGRVLPSTCDSSKEMLFSASQRGRKTFLSLLEGKNGAIWCKTSRLVLKKR